VKIVKNIVKLFKMTYEEEYQPRNREKSKQAKYGMIWCAYCDRDMVGDIGKCSYCGRFNNRKKIRYE